MTDTNKLTVRVLEAPGAVGALKASQIAHLIEAYIKKHPEIVKNGEETK